MGGLQRIELDRRLAAVDRAEQGLPFGMQGGGRLGRHPRGEAFVQPEIVPPGHGDEVAEPLVGGLVGVDLEDRLAPRLAGDRRVDQQYVLEREDRAPILHRAEELAGARAGDIVELGQRVGRAEIFVVPGQDPGRALQRPAALLAGAAAGDDADLGAGGCGRDPVELADGEEQEIGRHGRAWCGR